MKVWSGGSIGEASIPLHVAGPAFRSGKGVFETILHHGHRLPRFERHLERLKAGLEALGMLADLPGGEQLRRIVLDVALVNGLAGETARVNLFCFENLPGAQAELVVAVTPHVIEAEASRELVVYPRTHVSWLCAHKTMANLHQRLAWEFARAAGADDALLTGPGGEVLEAAVAALLFSDGHGYYAPKTEWKLNSLSLEAAAQSLPVEEVEIGLADLPRFRHAYWLNSLGGIQPVRRIDKVSYDADWETCRPLMRQLLGLDEDAAGNG